jgi:hypothetical protein
MEHAQIRLHIPRGGLKEWHGLGCVGGEYLVADVERENVVVFREDVDGFDVLPRCAQVLEYGVGIMMRTGWERIVRERDRERWVGQEKKSRMKWEGSVDVIRRGKGG